jgi:histidyl-tRNA synthetase
MADYGAAAGSEAAAIAAVDKLYKVGVSGVAAELGERGLPRPVIEAFEADQGAADPIAAVIERLSRTESGTAAYAEVRAVEELVRAEIRGGEVTFDPFIARGLDYYTGPVFEVFYAEDPDALPLSIASGGRYDDLISMFRRDAVPACGASLGLERIRCFWVTTSVRDHRSRRSWSPSGRRNHAAMLWRSPWSCASTASARRRTSAKAA